MEQKTANANRQPSVLRISRTFNAPRAIVFAVWGTAEHVKAWFSPETYSVSDAAVDLRVGGAFDVCMRSPDGIEHWTRGTFVEIVPDSRLAIEMHVSDASGTPLFRAYTEVDFSDVSGGTKMDVVQTYTFIDPQIAAPMVAGANEGWQTTLDKLAREIARVASP